jgi:hypothetical protein
MLLVGLAGCGVSRSGSPADEGDAAVVGSVTDAERPLTAPQPDSASSPEGLVRGFFQAAVGGGKAGADQVKAFLNGHALERWQESASPDNPPLTVIRLLHPPTTQAVTGLRTPVTVDYQVLGTLTDQGRVDELLDPNTAQMKFYVVQDGNNLRIDEIGNYPQPGLMLSDDALTDYYRIQPIYLWDTSYKSLVPDLRYVPLTYPADVRATRLVRWLSAGASGWLTGLKPMEGVTGGDVLSDNGTLTVKFAAEGPLDNDGLRRMLFQLQWTLRPPGSGSPNVRLVIDDKPQDVPAGADEYLSANRSWNFRQTSPPRYDITENKVVANPGGGPLPVLAGVENQNVVAAAIGRGGAVAAFVRTEGTGRRYLQIVRESGVLETALKGFAIQRPVFVPDSNDSVLVISGGRLYAVSGADGTVNDVTRGGGSVTSVSVSSDGRRVAFVANGQAYVASLGVVNNNISISGFARPVLNGQIVARSVTWLSESWLAVSGSAGGGSALWKVTADGVVAQSLSDSLKGVVVDDLVAYPAYPAKTNVDVLVTTTSQGVYSLLNSLAPEAGLHAPFYGS